MASVNISWLVVKVTQHDFRCITLILHFVINAFHRKCRHLTSPARRSRNRKETRPRSVWAGPSRCSEMFGNKCAAIKGHCCPRWKRRHRLPRWGPDYHLEDKHIQIAIITNPDSVCCFLLHVIIFFFFFFLFEAHFFCFILKRESFFFLGLPLQ